MEPLQLHHRYKGGEGSVTKPSEELHSVDVQYQHSRLTLIPFRFAVYKEQYCYKYITILSQRFTIISIPPSLQNNNITAYSRYSARYVQNVC
ncbi:hypothetical protein GDO78_006901 [Eleutherodactylus coqui]|uniref:Uncharacterized protein n=1 Tax=Eleutherodactylus coqui TaxID=57060 RepID=A0A8J6FGV9_ELECQ|nr:hypothetical protein GDO78_006901 [Eleutherodactylus coqui]